MLKVENRRTLESYYAHTNSGNFAGALQFFADDAQYRLPTASSAVPYAGAWSGKTGVGQVYRAFGEAFSVVDMIELTTISTEDELVSINDEIFVSKAAQSWRVGVAHQFRFRDGLITSLDVHLDLGAAHEALSGRTPLPSALLPVGASGSINVSGDKAAHVVASFFATEAKETLLSPNVSVFIPGDPRRLRFAGSWFGHEQVMQMETLWSKSFDGAIEPVRTISEGANIFAVTQLKGVFTPTRTVIEQPLAIFFQLSDEARIDRIFWYLNTYPFVALPH